MSSRLLLGRPLPDLAQLLPGLHRSIEALLDLVFGQLRLLTLLDAKAAKTRGKA